MVVGVLVLAVMAAVGTVGLTAAEPPKAGLAAGPGGAGATPQAVDMFLKIEGVDDDGLPGEEVEFTGVKLTYTQFDASGKPVGQTSAEGGSVPVIR